MTVKVAAIAVVALAGLARAQTCMWTESPTVLPRPQKRVGAAMAYDPVRQRVVLFGGFGLTTLPLGDTYEWTGTAWVLAAVTGPSSRGEARMVFHPELNKMILVGGYNGGTTFFSDTWTWDGAAWLQVQATGSAGIMAYDEAHSRMLGLNVSANQFWMNALNTATYTWELISGPVSRPQQSDSSYMMAYDSARSTMVIYGASRYFASQGAWWEFSGAGSGSWVHRGDGPPARIESKMAYDPIRGRTVIFGGLESIASFTAPGEVLGDVWECDGTTWIERTEDGPGRRRGHAMVFDGSGIFSFGGTGMSSGPLTPPDTHQDAWRYDGAQNQGVIIVQEPTAQAAFVGQSATFSVVAPGAALFQWYRDSTPLTNGGEYSGVTTSTLTINGVTTIDRATFSVQASAGCGAATAEAALRVFDQFCFANCDGSTVQPFLNINDFMCYLNQFATGDSRANCDGSTSPPTLNANDFQCFLGKFAAGCG